ncbi:MAG: helix-turn-helix transcriptional regulator [Oscillospiraceae bacterium]|nr:helix-turn-helix transcriptional regulator [Oscillospiraceae bacterium]
MSYISQNIKRLRILLDISQEQLAEKLSVTRQTVSSWERGKSHPDVMMLESLADALETDVNTLIYPSADIKNMQAKSQPLSIMFVVKSVFVYTLLLILGGGFAVQFFKSIFGAGIEQEYIYIICWGLVLLVGYIAYAVCVISEYFAGCYEWTNDE